MNKFAKILTNTLKEKGLTQVAFGQKVGYNYRTVCHWCNGTREPSLNSLLAICKALDETPNYLLGFDD